MNVETREIRDASELTDEEKASGKWIPVRRIYASKYQQKQPVADRDFARILAAEEKRLRKRAKRLQQLRESVDAA